MIRILETMWRRIPSLGLWLVVAVMACWPLQAMADGVPRLDSSHRGRGREGDPLDTNDTGGNPDPGDEIQSNSSRIGRTIFGRDIWSLQVLIVPHFNGSAVTFQVIVLSDGAQFVEGPDAK